MNTIVKTDGKKIFTDTLIISDGVGTLHKNVMELLKNHSNTETLSTFETAKVSRGGRPVEYAILSEMQATFLITLMRNSEKTVLFKEKLSTEFYKQREIISRLIAQQKDPGWQNVRKDGKAVYFQKTDIIKRFVEYAENQGSKSAKMYYTNLAKMENRALFFFEQKYTNLREVMTIKQLMQVSTADDVIEKALLNGMEENLNYKEIYKLAKSRIIAFAEIIGTSPILSITNKANK